MDAWLAPLGKVTTPAAAALCCRHCPLALPFLHSQTCFLTPSIAVNSTSGPPRLRAQGRLVMQPQVQSACLGDRMFAAMAACLQAGHSKASAVAVIKLIGHAALHPCMHFRRRAGCCDTCSSPCIYSVPPCPHPDGCRC